MAPLQEKASLESERESSEQARKAVESTLRELQEQKDDLRRKVLGMETQLKEYERMGESWEGSQARLKEKVTKLEVRRPSLPPLHASRLKAGTWALGPGAALEARGGGSCVFDEPCPPRRSAGRWRSRWGNPRTGSRSC